MESVIFKDLGIIDYKTAWDFQEQLLKKNVDVKTAVRNDPSLAENLTTQHYFFLCEHPPVYTLGKSGDMKNVLLTQQELAAENIQFFKTNRGGDITFHGPQQIVGYPILDLEKIYTDIGKYLRGLEEVVILTLAEYGIVGERSAGETGVWIQPNEPGKERKICAIGVRCSRWITMHGFALNANTNLDYFTNIIPCGIENKQVTSMEKELGELVNFNNVKQTIAQYFEEVFAVRLLPAGEILL